MDFDYERKVNEGRYLYREKRELNYPFEKPKLYGWVYQEIEEFLFWDILRVNDLLNKGVVLNGEMGKINDRYSKLQEISDRLKEEDCNPGLNKGVELLGEWVKNLEERVRISN